MTDSRDDLATRAGPPVEGLSYTEASRELDEIVHFFEQRDVDVDQLVGRLVRATSLIEELDKRLRQTRMQVEQLVPRLAAVLSEGPSSAGTGDPGAGRPTPASAPAANRRTEAERDVAEPEEDGEYLEHDGAEYDDHDDGSYDDEDDGQYDGDTDEDEDDIGDDDDTGDDDDGSTPGLF